MGTLKVELHVPQDIIGLLNVSHAELPERLQELLAIELFREGYISAGKGAEISGISKMEIHSAAGYS